MDKLIEAVVGKSSNADAPEKCGAGGYPSGDVDPDTGVGRIRLYTKADCDAVGGNWSSNGECLKKEGGSWSWDCRALNKYDAEKSKRMMSVLYLAGGVALAVYVMKRRA